jgi:O-antigen/teichoic acid export membrane protein
MASYSLQVFVIGISALVILQSDSLLIGLFMPVGMVALYMAAYRIYQTCRELAGSLLQPLIPDAAHARTLGYSGRLRRLFLDGTKYANALVLAFSVPTFVFAGPVLDAWVGPRFDSVAVVTQILLVALVINSNHFVAGALLTGMGRIARYARYHVAWAVSNVAVTVVLINQIGLRGVALGTALPLLVLEPLYVRTALREFELTAGVFLRRCVMPALGPAAGAGALLAVIALGFEPHDLVTVVGSSLAYLVMFIVLFARWGLSSSERASMARLVRRVGPAPAY